MDKLPAGIRAKFLRKQATKETESITSSGTVTPLDSGSESQIMTPQPSSPDIPFPTANLDECLACANPCSAEEEVIYPSYINKSIDRETPLAGSVKPYGRHVLISTGKTDWIHSIDEENGSVVQSIHRSLYDKKYGGRKRDGEARIVLSNTSFAPSRIGSGKTEVLVMPEWRIIKNVSTTSGEEFVKRFVDGQEGGGELVSSTLPFHSIVMICSHGKRDKRCGVTAKYLVKAFESGLRRRNMYRSFDDTRTEAQGGISGGGTVLGCLSHIGGHKFAGNVIIYRRRTKSVDQLHEKLKGLALNEGTKEAKAAVVVTEDDVQAEGIWLGRVEPKHVEAIIEEVILKGRIFKDLYRGGLPSKYASLQF
jgi:(2Fe-2S) ferredoxin